MKPFSLDWWWARYNQAYMLSIGAETDRFPKVRDYIRKRIERKFREDNP